jgi:hypothetical protein
MFNRPPAHGNPDSPASIRSYPASFSANGSSLLGLSGTLNLGSTAPARRYLRIVLRDSPPFYLPDRHPLTKMPAPDHAQ